MSISDSCGAGFKSLLQQRSDSNSSQSEPQSDSLAYYRNAVSSEPMALTDRVQLPPSFSRGESPLSLISFAPMPPSYQASEKVAQLRAPSESGVDKVLQSRELPNDPVRLRMAQSDQVSDFVQTPIYQAFSDPTRCRLEQSISANGTTLVQTDMKSLNTRTVVKSVEPNGSRTQTETVRNSLGKPVFSKVTGSNGDWEIAEMTYAVNPNGRESWALARKRVVTSNGDDTLTSYDKGRIVNQTTKPLQLLA